MLAGFAISGKAGAGKSTLAIEIQKQLMHLGWLRSARCSFAETLKVELWERTGLQKDDPGGREELIALGDRLRGEDPDYFVKKLAAVVDRVVQAGWVPVIDDVRRSNELDWCLSRGMVTIRVNAPLETRAIRLQRAGSDPLVAWSEHESECELDDARNRFHLVVENEGAPDGPCLACVAREVVTQAVVARALRGHVTRM